MASRIRPARRFGQGLFCAATSVLAIAVATPARAQEAAAPLPGSKDGKTSAPAENRPGEVVTVSPNTRKSNPATPPLDATGGSSEDIVVTGIRRGIADSIDLKRDNTSIVEAVSAEDIGKLPDVSIAESIARLPGLAAQRVNGRAQVISIRGLSPDFTTTLLNGRQQASSGDNRAVEFDQYPSELLSSVVVYKTPDAQIAGFGLSGTADLRTVRPLTFGKRAFAFNIRGEKTQGGRLNQDVRNFGGRISASYIDQFADGKIGLALGYAHLDAPSGNKHFKAYGYEPFGFAVTPDSADSALILNGEEIFATSRLNKRDALIGIVEFKPSEYYHVVLDAYYSRFSQQETTRGAQWFSNPYADNLTFTNVATRAVGGSTVASTGVQNGAVPIIRNDYNTRSDELISIGLNNDFKMDDRTNFYADLSYSSNKRREQILETYAGYGRGTGGVNPTTQNVGRTLDNIKFDVPAEGFPTYTEGLDYADASRVSLGDRAPWGGWGHDGAIRFPVVKESIYALDLRIHHEFDGFFKNLDVGVNYTHTSKDKTVDDNDLFLKNGRQQVLVDPKFLVTPTSLGWAGFGNVLSVDIGNAYPNYYTVSPIRDANYYDKAWAITEDVVTWHAKLDIDWWRLRGNIGVQVLNQTQRSSGAIINGANPIRRTDGASYTDVLPSLNLIVDLGGGQRLRFAASKTLARPRMDDMRANVSPGFNSLVCSGQPCPPGAVVNPWSASGGNPRLQPWRAKALDAAYEWYINKTTYFSVAAFYKKLDTYIYTQTRLFDFTGIPLPASASSIPPGVIISNIGQISLPANGKGGTLKGLEFSGAFNFGTITHVLDGFGVTGSLSLTDSSLNPTAGTDPTRIPGLSSRVYNLTAYFERGGFQVRASQRYRSGFKGEVVQLFATRGFTEVLSDKQVDAQIGYTFESGPLKGLGALFQVNNLTNSPYRTRIGLDGGGTHTANGGSLIETYEKYGRDFLFGFNYRF